MDHTIDDSDRLKPCPFCGGAPEFVRINDEADPCFGGVVASCLGCGAASRVYFPLKDDVTALLMEAWNKRTPDAALRAEADKSERRAIVFGDIVQSQVIAMRAAVVAAKLEGLDVGMQWIANTLCGPGHLPDVDEAKALGGAQALWDKETAEHEAFRAAHPAPGA
jgi:Lar family restriction alleviation protein